MKNPIRVQLGSGNRYEPGWVNVDLYAEKADIRADIRTVEFKKASVSHLRCVHVIEHITQAESIVLLRNVAQWLTPGGIAEFETPDRKKCLQLIDEGAALLGAKGLLGGRSVDKPGWHKWLTEWAGIKRLDERIKLENVCWVEIPEKWNLPGEQHLYCWEAHELERMIHSCGLSAKVGSPKHHGGKAWRDCRVVGTKGVV